MLKVLLEQQRGVSKSTLHACLEDNTTWDLVHDVEKLRDLKIEKWQVFGDPEEARWCWCILNNAGVLLEFKKVLIMLMDVGQLTSQAGFPMLKLGKVSRLGRVFWSVFPISSAPPFSCGNAAGAAALYPHRFHQYSRNPTPPAALTEPVRLLMTSMTPSLFPRELHFQEHLHSLLVRLMNNKFSEFKFWSAEIHATI